MQAVSYHDTVNVLQAAEAAQTDGRGPFDRAEWFALVADSGARPLVVQAGDTAMMLTRTNGRIEPLKNWFSFVWRPRGDNPVLLAAIARSLRAHSHRVTLWPVPGEDGSAERLAEAFRLAGWNVSVEQCDHNHVLPVHDRSFAQYWAARPGPMRTTLKRKAKKVAVTIQTAFDPAAWAEYEAIYAESWKPEEGNPQLLRRFAEAEGAAGRLRLGIARTSDGSAAAAQFWTVEDGTAYIHKLAHRESAAPLSAGTTLSAALFERAIDVDRVDLIDFGTGNDAYKRDWMEIDRPRYRIDALDARQPRAWLALARRNLTALARGRPRR